MRTKNESYGFKGLLSRSTNYVKTANRRKKLAINYYGNEKLYFEPKSYNQKICTEGRNGTFDKQKLFEKSAWFSNNPNKNQNLLSSLSLALVHSNLKLMPPCSDYKDEKNLNSKHSFKGVFLRNEKKVSNYMK